MWQWRVWIAEVIAVILSGDKLKIENFGWQWLGGSG
jgi:hypothetical protein